MDLEINSNVAVADLPVPNKCIPPCSVPSSQVVAIAPRACCNNASGISPEQGLGGSELVLSEGNVGRSCCLLGSVQPFPRAVLQTRGNK